jgi:glycosyltransferase involved in cell wall biosynthesis
MPGPKVSVLMLTCNRPQFLGRAIQSVVDQHLQQWELIVVHDGGDERTKAVMSDWEARDSRIRYFHRETPGNIAEATNFGIAQARGEYIAVLDDDDHWTTPDKLSLQAQFLDDNPAYVACGGGAIVVDREGNEKLRYLKPEDDREIKSRALIANPLVHSTLMYRSAAARALGGYNETLAGFQDWEFGLRLGLSGKLYNFPEYLVYYTIWNGGGSFQQPSKNTRSAIRIVWHLRTSYPHGGVALSLALLYHCYGHFPQFIRKHSFEFLAGLKKTAFAARRPAVIPAVRPILTGESQD